MKQRCCVPVLIIALALAAPTAARAATFVVNSTADALDAAPGDGFCATATAVCTLRAAIMEANAASGPDVVEIPAGSYTLSLPGPTWDTNVAVGDLEVTDHLTLRGAGSATTVIDAFGLGDRVLELRGNRFAEDPLQTELVGLTLSRGTTQAYGGCILHIGNGTLTLRDVVVAGCAAPYSSGGGIFHDGTGRVGRVLLIDSAVRDNHASIGGGIFDDSGTIELVRSALTGNTALGPSTYSYQLGGGIVVGGTLVATDSTISDNVAGRKGGGIYSGLSLAPITLIRTTMSGNEVRNATGIHDYGEGSGGAIYLERSAVRIVNSTISANQAADYGAGIYGERQASFQIAFSTIADNRNLSNAGAAGLDMNGHQPFLPYYQTLKATVLARNGSGGGSVSCRLVETVATYTPPNWTLSERPMPADSLGWNVDEDGSCGLTHETDLASVPAGLATLAPNGGLGHTHALVSDSPALDLVPAASCTLEIDDDGDLRIDEDPVNGVDDDRDWRMDEDPADAAGTDQRGVVRPQGAGCDAGSYEAGGPAEMLAAIQLMVETLIGSGTVNDGQGNALLTKLEHAAAALAANDPEQAIQRLEAFVNQLEAFRRAGILTPEEADPVLEAAADLIALLQP